MTNINNVDLRVPKINLPDVGGRPLGRLVVIDKVYDISIGMDVPIENGRTGEQALKDWENKNGDINEPTLLRNKRKKNVGEI